MLYKQLFLCRPGISSVSVTVAITTETKPRTPGVGMTGKTEIPVIVVPRSMAIKTVQADRMERRIGAAKAIAVPMTPGAGTSGIIDFMAGGAILNISARRAPVFGSPGQGRVGQRHPVFANVAIVAERPSVVAANAVSLFALSIETVSELIIKIMNTAGLVVASVTAYAVNFLLMTSSAPLRLEIGLFGVLMPPAGWMDIRKSNFVGVA